MAPASKPSDSDVALRAAIGGDLRPLKKMAAKVDLREAKDDIGRNALHLAALKGHLEVCKFLVEELGLDVNSTMVSNAKRPVHFAAAGGNKRVLGYLLDHGGDAEVPDSKGSTPLHDAAEQGHCEAIRLLLSKGVDVDPVNYRGTPLHLAASMGKDQALKILLEHGADAVDDGLTDIVKFLLEAGADPNIADEYGKIPIMDAAVNGQRELVEILFPMTRPIPSVPDWSVDGIIRSIKDPHFEAQDAALVGERIADAKSQGKEAFAKGEYISAIFFYSRHPGVVLAVAAAMAPASKPSDPVDDALQAAIDGDLRLLKSNHRLPSPSTLSVLGWTSSSLSFGFKDASHGFPFLVLIAKIFDFDLLFSGSDLFLYCCFCHFSWSEMATKVNLREAKDDKGRNALHCAAGRGHLEICRFLVEELGLDVNSAANGSGTSVHFAAVGGDARVLRYLLDHGGDPAVPDGKGSMPLHDAAEQGVVGGPVFFVPPGHYEAVRLLLSKGVDVDPVNHRGTPLHLAAAKDRDQVVKILLEHGADAGADVNFISPSGLTVLMKAADDGLTDMVKFLLQSGADPNIADEDGKIPIMFAAVHGHRELVEILFPRTRPIPSVPDWSVDGIIRSMKFLCFEAQDPAVVGERLADAKAQGKEAFAKGEYVAAIYFYGLVLLEPISTI
ncbi:hypothetical protein HU200_039816 [Digitaria exilis]|uniref:Uncharacterized protein n=1 Tax=Digitaria exilis TaxID=1010633 RepID=A0A835EF58_9POAL|nr:hypothetical protein HU200_039816 [Digitaria exilis]